MIKIPSPGIMFDAFVVVLRRFPLAMVAAVSAVITLIILTEDSRDADHIVKFWMVSMLGIPVFIGLSAFAQSRAWDLNKHAIASGVALLGLGLYWFTLDLEDHTREFEMVGGFMSLFLVSHLFVAVAPFLNNKSVRDFWEYNKTLFGNLILAVCFTLIIFFGLSLAILAVNELFELEIRERVYMRLFIILAGIFNTVFFLFSFPKDFEFEPQEFAYHFVFKNLCKFILIPIVIIYFVILYVYSFKILLSWNLPRGWVSMLVSGFSVAGIFTYLLNFYLPEQDDSPLVKAYRKWFWWVVLPMTALLFVAIGKRISDYGITEERYLIAHLGVWLLLNCLFFLFSKKENIKFLPITLGLFALVWAFGPFNATAVSTRSQFGRLKHILERNDRLENGKMKVSNVEMPKEDVDEFVGALTFLDQRNKLDMLTPYLPAHIDSLKVPTDTLGFYGSTGKLAMWLGIKQQINPDDITAYQIYGPQVSSSYNIKGFNQYIEVESANWSDTDPVNPGNYFKFNDAGD
ncbi:MAG: DUF4153 domain-containing protein, partial [Saprospiraceae bacterium]|nr:DUF4153 domain-containing protein [Saprospiraceae bacterium]